MVFENNEILKSWHNANNSSSKGLNRFVTVPNRFASDQIYHHWMLLGPSPECFDLNKGQDMTYFKKILCVQQACLLSCYLRPFK